MRGLDPRIHQAKESSKVMDCRVKPGKDAAFFSFPALTQHGQTFRFRAHTRSNPRLMTKEDR